MESNSAKTEVIGVILWYNKIDSTITARFLEELQIVASEIERNPYSAPVLLEEIRRTVFHRFPIMAFSSILEEVNFILILSISLQRRHPRNWVE